MQLNPLRSEATCLEDPIGCFPFRLDRGVGAEVERPPFAGQVVEQALVSSFADLPFYHFWPVDQAYLQREVSPRVSHMFA
jgi:hypothetical protein